MMRKTVLLIICVIIIGCTKSYPALDCFNEVNAGGYALAVATWEGQPIDLNGDGVSGQNILDELKESNNLYIITSIYGRAAIIPETTFPDIPYTMILAFPFQHVDMDLNSGEHIIRDSDFRYFNFEYRVSKSGICLVGQTPEYDRTVMPESFTVAGLTKDINFKDYTIPVVHDIQINNGWIRVVVNLPFYDFATDMCESGPVILEFKRVDSPYLNKEN